MRNRPAVLSFATLALCAGGALAGCGPTGASATAAVPPGPATATTSASTAPPGATLPRTERESAGRRGARAPDLSVGYHRLVAARDLGGDVVGPLPDRQRATAVIVFASWCAPCRHEVALLGELADREPRLRVIGLNAYEDWDGKSDDARLRAYLADKAPWLQVVRADAVLMSGLGRPSRIPSVFIFDRGGGLVRAFLRARRDPPELPELADAVAAAIRAGE